MKTKTIEIDYNGKKENVTLKRLNFGEDNRIKSKATKITASVGMAPKVEIDQTALKEEGLRIAITEAPWTIGDVRPIQELDVEDANKLWEAYEELNNQSPS